MNNHIYSLFPIPLGLYSLDRNLNKDESDFICSQKYYLNHGNLTSENLEILNEISLLKIKNFIEEKLNTFFVETFSNKNVKIHITQSWINVTHENGYHHHHNHPNSFISGVFYVNAKENVDSIIFTRPDNNLFTIDPNISTMLNSNIWKFPIKTNDLIIFPSYLYHSVPVNKELNHTRVSIAFNTFLKGEIGNKDRLTYVNL